MDLQQIYQKDDFFAIIESQLVKIANKRGLADPEGEARSWYVFYSKIYDRINSNPKSIVYKDLNKNIDECDLNKIKENFISYCVVCFKHYLLNDIKHETGKKINVDKFISIKNHTQDAIDEALDLSKIRLQNLIDLIDLDIKKIKNSSLLRPVINRLFLSALREHYLMLMAELGNICIVKNIGAAESQNFFIREIYTDRYKNVYKDLEARYNTESNESVKNALWILVNPEDNGRALRQKLLRYFSINHGGLHQRLMRKL